MGKEKKVKNKKTYRSSVVDLAYGYFTDKDVLKLEKTLKKMPKSCIKMLIRLGKEENYKKYREYIEK